MKKVLSIILTLVLVCSMITVGNTSYAYAAENEDNVSLDELFGSQGDDCSEVNEITENDLADNQVEASEITEDGLADNQVEANDNQIANYQMIASDNAVIAPASDIVRDVVLVLDGSGSMSGTPTSKMKSAAIKFCNSMLNAKGSNQIAIVAYDTNVRKSLNFTSDMTQITSFVNSISASGGTNIYAGFEKAKSLMDNSTRPTAIKNIILLTDGLPENGPSSTTGKYNSSMQSYCYRYANSVYSYFQDNLKEKYNVYTLGFFHSLSGSYLSFGAQFLKDIQNKGYYQVTNVEDLEFVLGDVEEDITGDNVNCPIVIIPGVMGSQLYQGSDKVWAPSAGQVIKPWDRLDDKLSLSNGLNVHNYNYDDTGRTTPINQALKAKGKREYGAQDTYSTLVDSIISEFSDANGKCSRSVYFFSYDFRYSNARSAQELSWYISDILSDNPQYSQVDIVAHSMGGLVTSSYIDTYGAEKVRKVITCGTPYEGSAKLAVSVLTNQVLDNGFFNVLLNSLGGLTKKCKASFPALAELVPTDNYFNAHASLFKQYSGKKDHVGFLNYKKIYNDLTLSSYHDVNYTIFNSMYYDAIQFHQEIKNASGYNILSDLDNSYFVVGINQKTVSGVTFNDGTKLSKLSVDDVSYETKGDGTVPYDSGSMMKKLETLPEGRVRFVETTHGGTVSDINAVHFILDVLEDKVSSVPQAKVNKKGHIVIRIACPVDVTIQKGDEVMQSNTTLSESVSSYGLMNLIGENGEIKMMCLDVADDYQIILNGTDQGTMDYSIRYFDDEDNLIDEYNFNEVPITKETKIVTGTDKANIHLAVDEDGDGIVDYDVKPGEYVHGGVMTQTSPSTYVYKSKKVEVTFEIVSQYDNKYQVNAVVKNITDETINDWSLAFDTTDQIVDLWNAELEENPFGTVLKNAQYNQDIRPGEAAYFGFVASYEGEMHIPSFFTFINEISQVDAENYKVEFVKTSDWEDGYKADIVITNLTDQPIEDWYLEFDFTDKIDGIWGAYIVNSENGHYILKNGEFNQNISAAGTITIGIEVSASDGVNAPSNYVMHQVIEK